MKAIFLTSSPFGPLDNSRAVEGFDPMNSLPENLNRFWKKNARCLVISAFPSDIPSCIKMRESMEQSIRVNFPDMTCLDIWDDRTEDFSAQTLASYDVVFLGGGHVPTENEFFKRIGLRESMQDYDGLVIGISAGTMNAAEIVYAQPELEGEALDPEYRRFIKGLGLTKINILPHYQMTRNFMLDGMRLFEDITYGDSHGRSFLVLPDGSYYTVVDGQGTVWGEAYEIADGEIRLICSDGKYRTYGADEYMHCDQCIRGCPVDQLRCANGRRRYFEMTGKDYCSDGEIPKDSGVAYRRKIRERRARKNSGG